MTYWLVAPASRLWRMQFCPFHNSALPPAEVSLDRRVQSSPPDTTQLQMAMSAAREPQTGHRRVIVLRLSLTRQLV